MSIEIICDASGCRNKNLEEHICRDCFEDLASTNASLLETIDGLRGQLEEEKENASNLIDELREEIKDLRKELLESNPQSTKE